MFRPCFTLSLVQVSSPPLVLYVKQSAPSCHSCLVQVSLGVSSICVYLVRGFDSVHCCHTSPCQVAHSFLCWFSGLSRPKTLVAFFVFRDYVCSPCFSHFPAFGSNQVKFACTQFGHSPPPPPQTIRHSKSKNEASCTCEGEEHASRPQQIVAALSEGEDDAQGSQDHE